jgi:hypothetical protein
MKIIRSKEITADRAWGAIDVANMGYLSPMQYEQRWYEAQRKKAA